MGSIRVTRGKGIVDRARAYKVLVDGQPVGSIKHDEQQTVPVPAGEHEVQMKVDWMRSHPVTVQVPDEGGVELYCEPRGKPVQYLFLMLFRPGHYIELRRTPR